MKRNVELRKFRLANDLTQCVVGEYLGIGKSFISRIEKGEVSLPDDKLTKLINNKNGWDVSMLVPSVNSGVIISGRQNKVGDIDNRQYYSDSPDVLKAQIQLLENSIKEKDAQIKEKDAQIKEKDAQINKLLEILSTSRI